MPVVRRAVWVWAVAVSLLAHLLIVGVIFFSALTTPLPTSGSSRPRAGSASTPPASSSSATNVASNGASVATVAQIKPVMDPGELKRVMNIDEKVVSQMSAAKRLDTINEHADQIGKMDSRDISAINASIASATGIDTQRAVEPRKDVKGDFDMTSALPCDIVRVVPTPKTGAAFRWTLVDKDGRSVTYDVPEAQMSNDDMNAYRVFETTRDNPNLRAILGVALRIGDKKIKDEKAKNR